MTTPEAAIERTFDVVKWLATELNDIPLDASLRNRMSGACFSVTQDHHCAIALLLEEKLFASAFALLRLQYEAYVRGLWLAECASEEQVIGFSQGAEPPKIGVLLTSLEKLEAYESGQLSRIKAESWSAMCSFTHTGGLQIQRWQTSTAIEPNYSPQEICEVANLSGSLALLSGTGMAALAKNEGLALRVLEKSRAFAQHEP